MSKPSKATTSPYSGAIIFEHIFSKPSNPNETVAVVNTNSKPTSKLDGYNYNYTAYAYPTRAQQWINAQSEDAKEVDLVIY
jgi:hypothetical protein